MKKILYIVVVLVVLGGLIWLIKTPGKPGQYDSFAQCVSDSGAIFYGAFWCPNCQNQKAMFGKSAKLLPYIECSTPDGRGQIKECTDIGVTAYPTWHFASSTSDEPDIVVGTIELVDIAEKTSCELPEITS